MKTLILLAVILFSCNQNTLEKDTQDIIKASKEKYTRDSTEIQYKMQIKIAKIKAGIVGDKDTLTDEEWLKKAEEDFKPQP